MTTTEPTTRRRDRYVLIDAALVRERRLALRLSADVLADLLGVSAGAIDHLEHGGEPNHLTISMIVDLGRILGLDVPELLAPPPPVPGGDGDLVDPEGPATVGRILAEVGTVHVDDLAAGLTWTLGRTLYALTVLEEHLPAVGQRLSWLANSQVAIIHAAGDPAPVGPVTRRTISAWGLNASEAAHLSWVIAKGTHRSGGQELNTVTVQKLKAAGLLAEDVIHGPRAKRNAIGEERLRLTDDTRWVLCLDQPDYNPEGPA